MSHAFGENGNDIPAQAAAADDAPGEPEAPTLFERIGNGIADATTRVADAIAAGPFGAVSERDMFSRPLHVLTSALEFKVGYGVDGEIANVGWRNGQSWSRQPNGEYDLGGESARHLRIHSPSGALTWQNLNGQMVVQYPDGDRFVEGANKARRLARA